MDEKTIMLMPLIGLKAVVSNSGSEELVGKFGKIIDETKNMVVIEEKNGKISHLQKISNSFAINVNGKKVIIEGKKIMFRPEEKAKNIKIAR